jgi:hypothetical protein
MSSASYVSIAIVEFLPENSIIVETISITPDSCDLSGAWKIEESDYSVLNQIIEGRLVMIIGNRDLAKGYLGTNKITEVDVQDFLFEARNDARLANESFDNYVKQNEIDYAVYMSVKPAERKLIPKVVKKKLVRPDFYEWPESIDINNAEKYLNSRGIKREFSGDDISFKSLLFSANLVKHFVDKWRMDELERSDRLYVSGKDASISILPISWLTKVK